ncbi:hypothetical protein O181_078910 [Austropuccinia psidii MF-1]|uniref:CCHC-type domain-containing protein n=1 Tax=Austropuccinia psidii MF-1 TaxID=1389203 RepID=A0A9Q3FKG1_9BASI|nr:hypothetical protein [Austropuccinia psidii MF-1]
MEDITTRTKIGRNWSKSPIDNKTNGKPITRPNKPQARLPLKCHKCGSTSHLENTCPKKTRINEINAEKVEDTKETTDVSLHESDSEPSEEEEVPEGLSIGNIDVSFEVTEVHTHLIQYSDECMDLIHVQDAKIQKSKPSRGKGYTAGSSCITNIVIKNTEAKIHLDSGMKFSSASQNMHPLGIFEAAIMFPHPSGSIILKVEIVVINNCTSQNFILGIDYLNIYGFDINNHKDRCFTIGENKRQKFAFPLEKREITVIKQVKNVNKEKFVSYQLIEAQISPELTLEMKEELIEILFNNREAFASDNEPLGAIKGNEVDIIFNVEMPYPPLLRRPACPASPRARKALDSHINELMKLGVLRKVGHNEEVEVTTAVIITWHNDQSRMVDDFRALNTYTFPDRYPIPGVHETLTQLSKARSRTSMDALKGFHQNDLTPHARNLLRIIAHCGIYEYLRMPFDI